MENIFRFLSSKIAFFLVCILFLVCSYWIYKNITLSDLTGVQTNINKSQISQTSSSNVKTLNLEIRNGDIVQVLSPDLVKLIVDHSKLEGVEGIKSLSYSDKTNKMCFIVETLTPEWIYVSNTDGSGLKKIALASTCEISPDGNYIAYINHITDVSRTDVYIYNLATTKITNETEKSDRTGYQRNYLSIKWTDGSIVEATYKDWLIKNYLTGIDGILVIDISSGIVSEK